MELLLIVVALVGVSGLLALGLTKLTFLKAGKWRWIPAIYLHPTQTLKAFLAIGFFVILTPFVLFFGALIIGVLRALGKI